MFALREENPALDPRERTLATILFGVALLYFLALASWVPFPGLPAWTLWRHVEAGPEPLTTNRLWGLLARGLARCPWGSPAVWMTGFSALSGAAAVALLGRLMLRIGYRLRGSPPLTSIARERQARRLSALAAALYLMLGVPWGVASTRSLPTTFHGLLALAAAWQLCQFQYHGRLRNLVGVGVFLGVSLSESPPALFWSLVLISLVLREMFFRQMLNRFRPHLLLWGGVALGGLLIAGHALALLRETAAAGAPLSGAKVLKLLAQSRWREISALLLSESGAAILALALISWLMLFVTSSRSPWFYDFSRVALRGVITFGLLAALVDSPLAWWRKLPPLEILTAPYLILAASAGFLTGEFWIMGELQMGSSTSVSRALRRAGSAIAVLLLVLIAASGGWNAPVIFARPANRLASVARDIVVRMDQRDVLFSAGIFDEILYWQTWQKKPPKLIFSASHNFTLTHGRLWARHFSGQSQEPWRELLHKGEFSLFVESFLMSDDGPRRTAILDHPHAFVDFAFLVPSGFLYLLESASPQMDLAARTLQMQQFWRRNEAVLFPPISRRNLLWPYHEYLRGLAARMANDLACQQLDAQDVSGALDTLQQAHRMDPDNLSVLLNIQAARHALSPESNKLITTMGEDRTAPERWNLLKRSGRVWNPSFWAAQGLPWAISGERWRPEANRRYPPHPPAEEIQRWAFLDQVCLALDQPEINLQALFQKLAQDERDLAAWKELIRWALRRGDPLAAETFLRQAEAHGLPDPEQQFWRAMLEYVQDPGADIRPRLQTAAKENPGFLPASMALATLLPPGDGGRQRALKELHSASVDSLPVCLSLAAYYQYTGDFSKARAELEKAVGLQPNSRRAWDLMADVAQAQNDAGLLRQALTGLKNLDPFHPLVILSQASELHQQGQAREAETLFRQALGIRRHPELLHGLASLIMERRGDPREVFSLLEEALRQQPDRMIFRHTLADFYLQTKRMAQAKKEIDSLLWQNPQYAPAQLLLLEWLGLQENFAEAWDLARQLQARAKELTPDQAAFLERWLQQFPPP